MRPARLATKKRAFCTIQGGQTFVIELFCVFANFLSIFEDLIFVKQNKFLGEKMCKEMTTLMFRADLAEPSGRRKKRKKGKKLGFELLLAAAAATDDFRQQNFAAI